MLVRKRNKLNNLKLGILLSICLIAAANAQSKFEFF